MGVLKVPRSKIVSEEIIKQIKKLKAQGLKPYEISKQLGISISTVSRKLRGYKQPTIKDTGVKNLHPNKGMKLEQYCLTVESQYFEDILYCINKDGSGMHIIYTANKRTIDIPIKDGHVEAFANELKEVYQHIKPRKVG